MITGVPVAVFLVVTVSLATSDPITRRKEGNFFQCAGYCKGSNKFKYTPGHTYVYDYTANTRTYIRGSTEEKSELHLSATAYIYPITQCNLVLQLKDVQLKDSDNSKSSKFSEALEKNSLHFSFQDGTVDELCPNNDPVWVLNTKRGILSAFQNTMHDFHTAREKRHETDVTGTCETMYDVMLGEDTTNIPVLYIGKMKNLLACSNRREHFLSLQSSPYMTSTAQSLPLIKSQQRGNQIIKDNILQKATNNEVHTFRPFSKHESGAVTMVNQILQFRTSNNIGAVRESSPVRRTTLLYEHPDNILQENNHIQLATELLQELVKRTQSGIESSVPSIFSQLIETLTPLTYSEISKLYTDTTDKNIRKFLLDAMPYIATGDAVKIMVELFKSGEISHEQMDSWFTSLAFQKKPTINMLASVLTLLDGTPSPKGLLSISTLVHSYCQQNPNCLEEEQVIQVMKNIEVLLGPNCESTDQSTQHLIILALKAIGNAGIFTGSDTILKKCLKVGNPIELRLAAISAYRRLSCNGKSRSHLLDLYANKYQDTELRIAAYLAVMQCPTSQIIRKIKDTLYGEEVNQVASFVWTHLTNLQETSSPWKQSIRTLVSSDFLRNKFKTDVRKFSRNYEGSFFSEALNAGAAAESNIIFTPQSYLPRSATLNLTLDMFGETINILEVGARAKGFEQIIENMFGPGGYFPDGAMNKMLKNLRDKSETENLENSINQLSDQFDAKSKFEKDPYASIYTRIFGNEIQYSEFHGLKDVLRSLNDVSSFDIVRKISQEENIDYTKSFVIINGQYSIPTCIGLPMNLNLNGTAAVSFKLHGHANIKDLFSLNSIDIEGSIIPSAAVAFTGTMAVDAVVTKAGIRLVNTLHTNTYIDGKIKIQGGNLIELKLNVPRDKIEVLEVSSQLFILHNDIFFESKGIEENVENYKLCSTEFISSLTGMKPCMELTYVNTSLQPVAPYFPLTGPFNFRIGITKVDTFNAYILTFRQQKEETISRQETSLSFHFDTPGSKVNRKLSAQYMIDWKHSVAKASLISPFIKISANGKAEYSDGVKTLDASISLNDQEIVATRLGLRKSYAGQTGNYEPFFSLIYRKQLIADISGKLNYVEGLKCNADFVIKGLTKDPISISGDFFANEDKYEMLANIKSKFLTSNIHTSFRLAENYLSTKAIVEYKIRNSQEQTLDFSAKLQDNSRGSLIRDTLYITLQMSQFPHYNAEALWDIQYSEKYFENNVKLAFGETVWKTQQLYRHYATDTNIELAILCTLTCDALDIDYGVDILHQVANESISSHFITTVTPRYKVSASLDYVHRLDQHRLDLDIKSPWYKTGLTGTLIEKAPGRYEIDASSWWAEDNHLHTLNASGFYEDGSNRVKTEHHLNVTFYGALNAKLGARIISSSNSNNQWIQFETDNKTYLANATYIKDVFHFMEGTLKLGDSTYGGSLVLLSTAVEKGFAIDLKLRKRLTMATKITCDGDKHGLQVELFWDKDANPNKKISLMAQAMGNRKEVLLEIPGRYLKGEVITIPSGVIGLLEWADHQKISAQLEWNLDEGSAEITVKLRTPFPSMESLSLFATYTMLENEGIFVVDGSWQKEKLTLTTTVRRNNNISGFWGMKLITHMESTIPSLEHLSFNLDHSSYINEQWVLKTVALLKYNEKQSDFEANWSSNESSIYGDIMLISPIQNFEYMKHALKYIETPEDFSLSLDLNWTQENKISGNFVIKKVTGASGAFKIITSFEGYEITSAEYNFTKFQDKNGTIHIRMEVDALYNRRMVKIDISGSRSESSFGGNLELNTPFTEDFKLSVFHSLKEGKFNEFLIVSLAEKQLLQLLLDIEVNTVSHLQLSASAMTPNQDVEIIVKHNLYPGNLEIYCQGKWNDKNLSVIAVGKCENKNKVLSVQFDGTVNGSVIQQELRILLNHSSTETESNTNLQLPYKVCIENVLTLNNELNWENRLKFKTPMKSLTIENKQSFNEFILEHKMTSKFNDQQASAVISLLREPKGIIREAKASLITPWSDPITIEYILPTDNSILKPSFTLKFKDTKEIKIEAELKFEMYNSKLHMKMTSPFYKPITVDISYQLEETNISSSLFIQWAAKKINAEAKAEFELSLMKTSGEFFVRHSDVNGDIANGKFEYNLANPNITAHLHGSFKECNIDSVLFLETENGVYKGKISMQTPLKNWKNLSFSGEVNLARPIKLVRINFIKEKEDITLVSLFGFEAGYKIVIEASFLDLHKFTFYNGYNISETNNLNFYLIFGYGYGNKTFEYSLKLQTDKESWLKSIIADCNLKTPFDNYKSLSVYGSYNIKGIDKSLNLRLIKDAWKFMVESKVSFGIEKGNSHIKVELPFEDLKEMSASVQYGFNPITLERTINLKISRNNLTVDVLGALLLTDNGSMTAGLEVTSPVEGFKKLKCSATLSAAKGQQKKSATIIFSKEHDEYAITGMFTNYTEARIILTTPLKSYEQIEANIGYVINKKDHISSGIKGKVYAIFEMSTSKSEMSLEVEIQEFNGAITAILFLPLLQVPQIELHGKYDMRSFPAVVSILVNKNTTKFINLQVILENNRLVGDIFTPIDGYEVIGIAGSVNFQRKKKRISFEGIVGDNSFQVSSSVTPDIMTSQIQAEFTSDFSGIERIAFHGHYDFQKNQKTAFLSVTVNNNSNYELMFTGAFASNTGNIRTQIYTPISGYETLLFIGKYNLKNDYSAKIVMERNDDKNYLGGHVAFTADGIAMRIETPFTEIKDISVYGRYYTERHECSVQLKITTKNELVVLDGSFKFQNNVATIKLQTPHEFMREIIIIADISGILLRSKESNVTFTIIKNSEYILKTSAYITIDWENKIETEVEFDSIFVSKEYKELSFYMLLTPTFPPSNIQIFAKKHNSTIIKFESIIDDKPKDFTYNLKLTSQFSVFEEWFMSINYYPQNMLIKCNVDMKSTGNLKQYKGELRFDIFTGEIFALFTTPIVDFEKFSLKMRYGHNFIYSELISSFKGYENNIFNADYEFQLQKKSGSFLISNNDNKVEFRTSVEHMKNDYKMNLFIVTPFAAFKKFDIQIMYMQSEKKKMINIDIVANDQSLEMTSGITLKPNFVRANLDISSTVTILQNVSSMILYDTSMTDAFTLGGKFQIQDMLSNISISTKRDLWEGELLASLSINDEKIERKIMWDLENYQDIMSAVLTVNLGNKLNFVFDGFLKTNSLKDIELRITFSTFQSKDVISIQSKWNATNIMEFYADVSVLVDDMTIFSVNGIIDLDNATEINMVHIAYLGIPLGKSKIHIEYLLRNNSNIELTSEILLNDWDLVGSLNFSPYKANSTLKCNSWQDHTHFFLGFDLTTQFKLFDIQYQYRHYYYAFSSNITLDKLLFPLVTLDIKTPIKHYSVLRFSNQYIINSTHTGMKILLEKEKSNGEIMLLLWKVKNNFGLEGILSIPIKNFKTWYGNVSIDTAPEFLGIINIIRDTSDYFTTQIKYTSASLKASITTPINGFEIINAEYLLDTTSLKKKGHIALTWGENTLLLNGSMILNKNKISKISLLITSPWTNDFGFTGQYQNEKSTKLTVVLIRGSKITQIEGNLKYIIKDSKFDIDFISEYNNEKILVKAGYDLLTPVKETHFNIQFGSSSLQGNGLLSTEKINGNMHIKMPFSYFKKVYVEGEYNFGQSLVLTLKWNDKLFNLNEEHDYTPGYINGSLTLVTPYITIDNAKFNIIYGIALTEMTIENSDKSLYFYHIHQFKKKVYSVQSIVKVSAIQALRHLSFSADINTEKLSASITTQWNTSKSVNISASIVPDNLFVMLETPFKDMERIMVRGTFKNERNKFEFTGNVQSGSKNNTAYVQISIDKIIPGEMKYFLFIGMPSGKNINSTFNFQFTDPSNIHAKFIITNMDIDLIIEGALNLKDLIMNLNINLPSITHLILEADVTYRTWKNVKINSNIKYNGMEYKYMGSYIILNKHFDSQLSLNTPNMNSTTILGGSYKFNGNDGMEIKFYFNDDQLQMSYLTNAASFIGNVRINSKILGINKCSLMIEGTLMPTLQALLAYEYNTYSGKASFSIDRTKNVSLIKGSINFEPFYIPMNHTVKILFNNMISENYIELIYEGKISHKINISYETNDSNFKIKTDINSKIFGQQEVVMLMDRNWEMIQFNIVNMFSAGWNFNYYDATFFVTYLEKNHILSLHVENDDGFEGQLEFVSPYLVNEKINLMITAKTDSSHILLKAKYVTGIKTYLAALEILTSTEEKLIRTNIITPTMTILGFNASLLMNEKIILAESMLNIMDTLSSALFKLITPLNTELNITSPYLPKKTIRLVINTNSSGMLLYTGHGDTTTGHYIMLKGTLNKHEGEVDFGYKVPIVPFVQFVMFKGNFKLDPKGAFNFTFNSQFSSQTLLRAGLLTEFTLSKSGIVTSIKFMPHGEKNEIYEAGLHVPFTLSNNMRPRLAINAGNNHTYSLHATYVNLKDIQEVGFGIQYKLRKLGASLKIENEPVTGIQADIDMPIGHYGIDFKTYQLLNTSDSVTRNLTQIGVVWDRNRIELSYSLSYVFTTLEKLLNNDEILQCTMVLQLTTPFQGYEQNGLQMHVSLSSSNGIILTSLNYPGSSKPFVIELNYELRNHNDATLITQLQIPFIPALEDIAIVISNKIDGEHGRFRIILGGHWNKEKLLIHVEGNLTEEIVLKGSIVFHLLGQIHSINADFGSSNRDSHYLLNIQVTTPFSALENHELYVEVDLTKYLLINVTHNHKELFHFHVYSNEVTQFGVEVRNPWTSVYFVFGYDISKDILIKSELSLDMAQLNKSKLGLIIDLALCPHRKQSSFILELPTRSLVLNLTYQRTSRNIEYGGTFSWEKGQIIGFKVMTNIDFNSRLLALNTIHIDLPRRSFELQSYASIEEKADSEMYGVGTTFLWDALNNRDKKIGIELKYHISTFEVVLKHVALENDLKIRIEKTGKLSYNELPFKMKIEIEYSALNDDLITIETYVQQPPKTPLLLDMGFSVCHLASSLDFSMRSEIAHSSSDNHGSVFAEYLNSHTGQKHKLELMGKISLLRPEVKISVRTAENLLEARGFIQTDNNDHFGVLIEILMNQKEPLSLEAGFTMLEPKIEVEVRYGKSRSYKAYAGIPHSREINFGIKHLLYENDYDDVAVILQLNTSQLLWSRIKWQPKALTELRSSFFQEYADIFHVIQSVGSGYFEVWLKDVTHKYNTYHTIFVNTVEQIVSTSMSEVNNIYMDFIHMGDDMITMYRRNDFYMQDIQPYASKLSAYIKDKVSGTWKLLLDGLESIYSTIRDIVKMITSTLQIDLTQLSAIFNEIKVTIDKTASCIVKLIKEIKQMHASAKEYLKMKIEAARLQLAEAEKNMKQIVTDIKHYIDELLTSYIELLEPYLTYFENTMELLSRRVIDFEDKISEYILDMVDNVLGAEEVQELIETYNKYSTWLEELHLQEYIDKIYKLQESITKLIMNDVRRVCADYLDFVDYAVNIFNNIYKNINAMPVIAYTKQAIIIIYEKAKWTWQHYELSDYVKNQIHSWIDNLDKILLQLLNAIDMDASSPTKSLTPSITLRPDIGFIEYTQKLPIDWNGFNELPKFEQLQLYEQAKDQADEIANLEKYRYFLMDTIYDITSNMSIASLLPPFSANGMVIGKRHYITFDKKFYNFLGKCSYLLASDFLNNKFSAFVTYKLENKEVMKSLTILIDQHRIEINSNKYVTVDGKKEELPMQVSKETWIKRTGDRVTVHSDLGIEVECNLHYDFCSVELSGWYFSKTGGLLGTFDYEPTNDLQFPNGTAADTIEAFANSWYIGSGRCRSVNHATLPNIELNKISDTTSESNQCTAYFDQLSPLRPCFSRIEVQPYLQMCLSEIRHNEDVVCLSVAAYVSQCRRAGVDVVMPHTCVRCQSSDGHAMNSSELKVYDGVESKMADIVFVIEQAPCIKNISLIDVLSKLDTAMNSHGYDTRFSIVGFNGKQFSEPHSWTSNGEIWSSKIETEKVLRSLQSVIPKDFDSGSQYAFSALWHASHLPFRETASKTLLLIQCTSCTDNEDDYSDMITMLLENDITLHILQPNALKLRSSQGKASKVYGVDLNGAFSGRNLKTLVPSLPLLRQVELPKDLCTPLAFETNGTLFNMDRLLQNDSNKVNMKKFLDIWARRITLTAKPSQCQKCQCMANQDSVGQIMCSKCLSPSIEQYLKEWENLKLENLTSEKGQDDYFDWPV